jgi:exonuclease SbcC
VLRDFRSIRQTLPVPLDADVIVIHGENGAGKTSILSAIELALTGEVRSLARADPNYKREHTNKDAVDAMIEVVVSRDDVEERLGGTLDRSGATDIVKLNAAQSDFFADRC